MLYIATATLPRLFLPSGRRHPSGADQAPRSERPRSSAAPGPIAHRGRCLIVDRCLIADGGLIPDDERLAFPECRDRALVDIEMRADELGRRQGQPLIERNVGVAITAEHLQEAQGLPA